MLAACAARRWLARNAAGVIKLTTECMDYGETSACTSLVCCLPALEDVTLVLLGPLKGNDLGCLLEALAGCPRLRALDLSVDVRREMESEDLHSPFPDAAAFAKLRSLTKLALSCIEEDKFLLADVVSALTPLTGLAELRLGLPQTAVVPAALGQFKGLRSLTLYRFRISVLKAGCLELPNLLSLQFILCDFPKYAQVLPSVTGLQCLTRLAFSGGQEVRRFDTCVVQLPQLQHLAVSPLTLADDVCSVGAPGLFRLPADMGLLSSSLLHFNITGLGLMHIPLAVTLLRALQHLNASMNEFAELPGAITALSGLKELRLGRVNSYKDPLQLHGVRRLDVRALGDVSGFPALHELTFNFCEVVLCHSMLGAVQHACLTTLCFRIAHPAPECTLMVLQLSQALRRTGRGSVVSKPWATVHYDLRDAQGQAPCQKFAAALKTYEL